MTCSFSSSKRKEKPFFATKKWEEPIGGLQIATVLPFPTAFYATKKEDSFIKGIYISNPILHYRQRFLSLIREASYRGVNAIVADIQPRYQLEWQIKKMREKGFYLIARIVVHLGGFTTLVPNPKSIEEMLFMIHQAGRQGFDEVQLDYIRYADSPEVKRFPLRKKYQYIASILAKARKAADSYGMLLSADVFGRVTLNYDDPIGQKLELFARYVDRLYPMLYPSHYYHDERRQKDPYFTVKDGVKKARERISHVEIIPFIQGFKMLYQKAGVSFVEYIFLQMKAAKEGGARGFIVWNPRNVYHATFQALERFHEWLAYYIP